MFYQNVNIFFNLDLCTFEKQIIHQTDTKDKISRKKRREKMGKHSEIPRFLAS